MDLATAVLHGFRKNKGTANILCATLVELLPAFHPRMALQETPQDKNTQDGDNGKENPFIFPGQAWEHECDQANNTGGNAKPQKKRAGRENFQNDQKQPENPPGPEFKAGQPADKDIHGPSYSTFGTEPPRRVSFALSLPNTSCAIAPIPPSVPMSELASIGMRTTLELRADPISFIASVYFWATK